MPSNFPKISDSEWQVMKVLWEDNHVTSNHIVEKLTVETNWKPKTIRTLISRLNAKGAIGFDKDGRQYKYYPMLSQDECIRREIKSLLIRTGVDVLKPVLVAILKEPPFRD